MFPPFTTTIPLLPFAVEAFPLSNNRDQTIIKIGQSAHGTGEALLIQKNNTDLGSKITEGVMDLDNTIGKGLDNLGHKFIFIFLKVHFLSMEENYQS